MKIISLVGLVVLSSAVGCSKPNPRVETRLNEDARLMGELTPNPMQGKVITSWVDKRDSTMSTLYGNDAAVNYARRNAEMKYPAGSVVSLVTWNQQEDGRWFGGKIPATPKSVEVVSVGTGYSYQRFEGSPLKRVENTEGAAPNERAAYLLSQRAAVLP
ncbi:cytochrome P460 family protein [Granulicella sp. dw_53]|uniref:cytochrome P460 family protein n=1 Tax=Granulicella sp. dw_53 TaxID=2719792 RepID=UPI001BD6664C|nr:cytochrome P460 family protein [Granulicella sp. dw_53]